jgi:hypothetical protein
MANWDRQNRAIQYGRGFYNLILQLNLTLILTTKKGKIEAEYGLILN